MKRIFPYALVVIGLASLVLTHVWYGTPTFGIRTQTIEVTSLTQIVPVTGPYVKPMLYTHISGLSDEPVVRAKQTFVAAVLPAVLVAKHQIEMMKIKIKNLRNRKVWDHHDSLFYLDIKSRYNARDIDDLMLRMGSLPTSIVLAQAAVESGWGQSRFFLEGNNLFGVWSFNRNEPRIAAGKTRKSKTVYLRKYGNISESIVDYFEILASSRAYEALRRARISESDPLKLIPHLSNFSERRGSYTRQLKSVMLQNRFTLYDNYQIDPDYIFEE